MSGCLKKWWLQVVNVAVRVFCGQGLSTVIMVMVGRMLRSEVVHVGILVSVSRSGFQQGHDHSGSGTNLFASKKYNVIVRMKS